MLVVAGSTKLHPSLLMSDVDVSQLGALQRVEIIGHRSERSRVSTWDARVATTPALLTCDAQVRAHPSPARVRSPLGGASRVPSCGRFRASSPRYDCLALRKAKRADLPALRGSRRCRTLSNGVPRLHPARR